MPVPIHCKGLVKRFGETTALDGLDLCQEPGETLGLLGPNGAGKTTTVKILLTLFFPTSGQARVLDLDVTASGPEIRRKVGYVPQELTSDPDLTGRENLDFFARIYALDRPARRVRIAELLDRFSLVHAADRLVKSYSGGMRKRLDLAVGLLHDPELVILDEPSLGLDVEGRQQVWEQVRQLKRREIPVLLCTNSMEEADTLADRVAVIHKGRRVVCDTPEALKRDLGGDMLKLELHGGDAVQKQFEESLRGVELVHAVHREGDHWRLVVADGRSRLPVILQVAADAGLAVKGIDLKIPSLEQVFLHHTGFALMGSEKGGEK